MGEFFRVQGGHTLNGSVRIPAAKNSVLPLLAASLLCEGETLFTQMPQLADVQQSITILSALGCECSWRGRGLSVRVSKQGEGRIPDGAAKAMRSSVFYLAPCLHRFGWVQTPMPGGCKLGPRPIDIHLDGLCAMGATTEWQDDLLTIACKGGLRGADFTLRLPSVGATETLIMAAVLAKGDTVLRGAAMEPEIVDLANFLQRCGANIQGAGTPQIRIRGVHSLRGAIYTPIPDRIVAATLAAAVAAAGGRVCLQNCQPETVMPALEVLRRAGCRIDAGQNAVTVSRNARLRGVGRIYTGVYPAFSTDAAPMIAAALLTASGRSAVEDTIFENRFACADGFAEMGARVQRAGRSLEIEGVRELTGASVQGKDLRGGAALVVAALAAKGESCVAGVEFINRGYSDLMGMLNSLGANIRLESTDES